jgi:transcriptional regulator with XRE-family HTH domain
MNPGQRIKNLRDARNINQTKLAQILGISSAALSAIEKGKNNPNYETLIEISNFFKVSTDYLLTGKEELTGISAEEREILEVLRKDEAMTNAVMEFAKVKKKAISFTRSYAVANQNAEMG